MVDSMYWVVDIVFGIVICIFLAYTYHNKTQSPKIDKAYKYLLIWGIYFCAQDAIWGVAAGPLVINDTFLKVSSIIFHLSAVLSTAFWLYFIIVYLDAIVKNKRIIMILELGIILLQLGLVIANIFTPTLFSINDAHEYVRGPLRWLGFLGQYSVYLTIGIISTIFVFKNKGELRAKFIIVVIFVSSHIITGAFQFLYPDAPFHAIGYFCGCVLINLGIVSREHDTNIIINANTDGLTGLNNRKMYEDYLKKNGGVFEDNIALISFDVNGLKVMNDSLGHDAGDELLLGTTECMKKCFGAYGSLYRIGGDEFVAIIKIGRDEIVPLIDKFMMETSRWRGSKVDEINVSLGYVLKDEFPEYNAIQLAKVADERMYKHKKAFYGMKQYSFNDVTEVNRLLDSQYIKILKIDLVNDQYIIVKVSDDERKISKGYSEYLSKWLIGFGNTGQVHKDDLDDYLKSCDIGRIRKFFDNPKNHKFYYSYRRLIGDKYKNVSVTIIRSEYYSKDNQIAYLFVKENDD